MAQITTGARRLLSVPRVYDAVQTALGAHRAREVLVADYLRPVPGQQLLDVGCGTGELFPHLPPGVRYVGFDLSPDYIRQARDRYASRARFECMDVADFKRGDAAEADVVVAVGLLHHLGDDQAHGLLRAIRSRLRAGGRLVTMDPTFLDRQPALATFMMKRDRGQNIRTPVQYAELTKGVFSGVACAVREDLLRIPYSHCIMECTSRAS
ncbi:MAG: class I SAM-dependent methyltransferase [Pseudomonadota bacterium]|nr:class I SAM-dependent methyltransferase [Pseudomonadota bacterium]